MKRFKFAKILYYGFMFVIGLILCFVLPGYNQYNALLKTIRTDIKKEKYDELPGFFSVYYNSNPVYSKTADDGAKIFLYESCVYKNVKKDVDAYYTDLAYMGIIINPKNYDYKDAKEGTTGEKYNNSGLLYNGESIEKIHKLDSSCFNYIDDLNFIYFDITQTSLKNLGVSNLNSIVLTNNKGESKYEFSDLNLSFDSDYFKLVSEYKEIFNRVVYERKFTVNGNPEFGANGTKFKNNDSIEYNAYGNPRVVIDTDNIDDLELKNIKKVDDYYEVESAKTVKISCKNDVTIRSIKFIYNEITISYGFEDGDFTYKYENNEIVSQDRDEDKQEKDYDSFKIKYDASNYSKSNYRNAFKGVKAKSVFQVVMYFIVILIVGDFLVGSHHIIKLINKMFGKNKDSKKEDSLEPNSDYEVNVICTAKVPSGYQDAISVVFEKEDGTKMAFELLSEKGYKDNSRFKNGDYKISLIDAKDLHLINSSEVFKVRGFRCEVILTFAYNDDVLDKLQ